MSIEIHPICDTDIWVACSQIEMSNILFESSYHVYIADAVKFELESLRKKDCERFGIAFDNYKKYKSEKTLFRIDLNSTMYFDNDTHLAVKRKFKELKIPYCFVKEEYTAQMKNLGETVTVIFAGILELPVILSNDKETPSIALTHYQWLKVHDIKSLMNSLGKDQSEISKICNMLKSLRGDDLKENELERMMRALQTKYIKN